MGYSVLCWIVGIGAYAGAIAFFRSVDVIPKGGEVYGHIYTFYLWAAVPILIAVAIVVLVLRPIFVLAVCDLYSDHLNEKGIKVELPENPPQSVSAITTFCCLCLIVAVIYMYRNELGIIDMLSTPAGSN